VCAKSSRSVKPAACRVATLVGISLLAAGCASRPEKQLTEVEKAREEAAKAKLELYVPEAVAEADRALEEAKAELATQDGKFIVLRNYKGATVKLDAAFQAYAKAAADGGPAKRAMSTEARAVMKEATIAADAAEQILAKLTATRPGLDLTAWQTEMAGIRGSLADGAAAIESDDFVAAKAKFESAFEKANELRGILETSTGGA
jgi:hypothetical protein